MERKKQRSVSLTIMRSLGWGKSSIEEKIKEESTHVISQLRATKGKPYNPANLMELIVANIICSMLFGERYDHDDEEFKSFLKAVDNMFLGLEGCMGAIYAPWLRFFAKKADQLRRQNGL